MDTTKKYNNPNPQDEANPFSQLFFCWLMPFLKYGSNNDLKMKDIYNTRTAERSEDLTETLEKNWNKVCDEAIGKNLKPSLLTAIKRTFIVPYVSVASLSFIRMLAYIYGMPTALDAFINYFSEVPRDLEKGAYLGGIVLLISFLYSVSGCQIQLYIKRLAMRMKIATGGLIYRKVLRLNKASLETTDVGNVVNLLSNDLNRFDMATELYYYIWFMPVVAALGTYVMYTRVGLSAFVGIGAMLMQSVSLQGYLSKLQGRLRYKIAGRTDSRVKLMNEITKGIQVIKMCAWEKPFEKIVENLRKKEMNVITNTSYIKALTASMGVFTERFTLYIIVVVYVLMGNELNGGIVFSISQVINLLQLTLCIMTPRALSTYAEAKTSISRIEKLLMKGEKDENEDGLNQSVVEPGSVKLKNVHATWTPDSIIQTLIDVSFELPPGSLCCIIGNIGSGKSSILQLILKELPLSSGSMSVGGKISYATQEPWLFVSNVRNNILFGQPFHKDKYKRVIKACALERDFQLLPYGDKTNVGEDGVALSGGQRARVNLARAIYREADVYLLDDPLSVVDPQVAKQLVDSCVMEYLGNKTRILVTHQTQFLNQANFVLVLNNGRMEKFIKPSDLSMNDLHLIKEDSGEANIETHIASQEAFQSTLSLKSDASTIDEEVPGEGPKETDELIKQGAVDFSVYRKYYTAGVSNAFWLFEIFLLVAAQMACNSADLWVTYWTNNVAFLKTRNLATSQEDKMIFSTTELLVTDLNTVSVMLSNETESSQFPLGVESQVSSNTSNIKDVIDDKLCVPHLTDEIYIQLYTVFTLLTIILTITRSLCLFRICMKASLKLHNYMFQNILQAKMRFFDTNPSGRILNRFSNDIGAMDEILPLNSLMTLQVIFIGSGILVMMLLKSYFIILPAVILGMVVWWCRKVFLTTAQNVKRIERIAKAPVYSHVAATLRGLSTIRSSNAEDMLSREFDAIQNEHTSTNYLFIHVFQAFGFFLDLSSFAFLAVLLVQFLLNPDALSGDVGLVLTQSLIVIAIIQRGTGFSAEVANQMTGVERILQYTKLDKEGPFESLPRFKPPKTWPKDGRISFKNVYLRYVAEEEPVLKNLIFEIQPEEKVGIVGRTGAGKSSLISAIFRLATTEGTIMIDDLDIGEMGLTDLRSKISIIPQEPILFSESLRYNLDPFGNCHDDVLWNALEAVELKEVVNTLDMVVNEGGSNFSVGQRQLICLARAIVRNNKILVMDEATANVDPHTDSLIQKSIRENFKHCTVLTVAHRLNTIIDSDKVIVMDAGEIKEFGHPHILLQNGDSAFSKMVEEAENGMEHSLRKIAEKHFLEKEAIKK